MRSGGAAMCKQVSARSQRTGLRTICIISWHVTKCNEFFHTFAIISKHYFKICLNFTILFAAYRRFSHFVKHLSNLGFIYFSLFVYSPFQSFGIFDDFFTKSFLLIFCHPFFCRTTKKAVRAATPGRLSISENNMRIKGFTAFSRPSCTFQSAWCRRH